MRTRVLVKNNFGVVSGTVGRQMLWEHGEKVLEDEVREVGMDVSCLP